MWSAGCGVYQGRAEGRLGAALDPRVHRSILTPERSYDRAPFATSYTFLERQLIECLIPALEVHPVVEAKTAAPDHCTVTGSEVSSSSSSSEIGRPSASLMAISV